MKKPTHFSYFTGLQVNFSGYNVPYISKTSLFYRSVTEDWQTCREEGTVTVVALERKD